MKYSFLDPSLHSTADAVGDHFKKNFGARGFLIEKHPTDSDGWGPTISATLRDHHHLCIEVSYSAYPDSLDAFILDSKNRSLPVKVYVAIPKGSNDPKFQQNLKRAQQNGVGVVEVDNNGTTHFFHQALPLSLTGLRPPDYSSFPPKYRPSLNSAVSTFQNGNPEKGCSMVYDEIENLTRRLARKTKSKGYWRFKRNGKPSRINIDSGAWGKLFDDIVECLDLSQCACPLLTRNLLSEVAGIIPHRNETGHKPKNPDDLKRRDSKLRTRFESAVDLLYELIEATKPLHL